MAEESTVLVKDMKTYAKDLFERVLWTFLSAAGGVALAAGPTGWLDVSVWEGAATAGLIAVGTFVKGLLAHYVGNPNSASTVRGV
jgi:hypothetical protein